MMRLPPFTYLSPVSVGDAVKLMADHGPEAMLVAGGTDLYPNMKRRQFEPAVLVGLRGIKELAGVRRPGGGGLAIGAGTTLTAVSRHPEVRSRYAALYERVYRRLYDRLRPLYEEIRDITGYPSGEARRK